MEDILSGIGGTGTADASMQFDFSLVLNLVFKIVLSILSQAGVFEELASLGVDFTQYISAVTGQGQ